MKSILLYITLCLSVTMSSAQQFPDRHSTSFTDAWLSCTPSANPNSERGESHWIRYNLGATFVMSAITLWNYNDPNNLNNGVQEIAIDISSDGVTWTEAGTAIVSISEGSAFYEGENIIDLGGISADYLLITILSNYGGTCSGFSEIRVSSAAVLPIELSSQEARCTSEGDAVIIVWNTVSEIGNDFFTIQKSNNAKDWYDLGELTAIGSNGLGAEYYYEDKEITGSQYYRIVNTDLDGQKQYFDVMAANCDGSTNISMSVVNPFTETLVVTYFSKNDNDISYSVESLDGKMMYTERSQGGTNTLTISSSDWIPGTYMIIIQQNGQIITEKVVKI